MTSTATLIRAALRESSDAINQREDQARHAPERRATGRYTLNEAEQEIQLHEGEDASRGIGLALSMAIKNGSLIAYQPRGIVPLQPSTSSSWLECYADDLNAWLKKSAPLINFRFPTLCTTKASLAPETKEERQARRYQICVQAGLNMPTDDYGRLPDGIGKLAKKEGVTQQAFSKDVKAYIARVSKVVPNR